MNTVQPLGHSVSTPVSKVQKISASQMQSSISFKENDWHASSSRITSNQ